MLTLDRAYRVDALRPDRARALVQIVAICLFAIATAAGAKIHLYLWEVPLTLQTVFVYGSGLFLGTRNACLSMLLYLGLGLFLPVFAGQGHGLAYVMGAVSGGYLLGMPLAALVIGYLSGRWTSYVGSILSTFAGSLVLFTCGVIWLHYAAGHATWWQSLDAGWLRFVGFDAIKVLLASGGYAALRRFL
ncbi:MAG: biotin transporter BioY [Bacteroidota bacterium]|nr:biotin transporter BioY [Bacteroidota bacterium]